MSETDIERIIRLEEGLKTQGLLLEQRLQMHADAQHAHIARSLEQWKKQEMSFEKLHESIASLRRCYDARENQAKGALWASRSVFAAMAVIGGIIGSKIKAMFGF